MDVAVPVGLGEDLRTVLRVQDHMSLRVAQRRHHGSVRGSGRRDSWGGGGGSGGRRESKAFDGGDLFGDW